MSSGLTFSSCANCSSLALVTSKLFMSTFQVLPLTTISGFEFVSVDTDDAPRSLIVVMTAQRLIHCLSALYLAVDYLLVIVPTGIRQHFPAGMGILRNDGVGQVKSAQRAHAAQCYVQLSCRKHPPTQVQIQLVERHTLTLMHRDGPSQSERILRKSALQFLLHFPAFAVILIVVRLPRAVWHYIGVASVRRHLYLVLAQFRHGADSPVCPPLLLVVTSEHHLCPHLQL